MRSLWLYLVPVLYLLAGSLLRADDLQIGRPLAKSLAPPWDLRGPLNLPGQGIACADMTPDGRFIAVGTIAPAPDPNAFLLDENGKLVEQQTAGLRWVNEVVVGPGGGWWGATSTFPHGAAGDLTELWLWAGGKRVEVPGEFGRGLRYIYTDHENGTARLLQAAGDRLPLISSGVNSMFWLAPGKPDPAQQAFIASMGVYPVIATAANAAGRSVVARIIYPEEKTDRSRDLVLLEAGAKEPLWGRPLTTDAEAAPPLEKGVFGPPAPPYEDHKLYCALSVAIDAIGERFAAADYQGWDRYFEQYPEHDVRLMPARPTIQVYDAAGNVVRRFGPETFRSPFWCDLAFLPDSDLLLAYPRSWTCRGLAGRGFLPVDDGARTLYALAGGDGTVKTVSFPDTIASVAVSRDLIAVACWDRRVYLLDHDLRVVKGLEQGVDVGDAALVKVSEDGKRVLVAGADGVVRRLDAEGKEIWRTDLNQAATPGPRPWLDKVKSGVVGPGVWTKASGGTESDLGGQYIIQAPGGLLLGDPNAGAPFEANWEGMKAAGLDPMQVKYILLTHEHGDHSPAAYLWRVRTGAKVVASPEMAYMLRYRPWSSGYGEFPPHPVDVLVDKDETLDLAGLKVTCVRTPGHTYGSLSYVFDLGDQRYCMLGDLIMPGGAPGYWGSLDFSASDILSSLRKLQALKPTYVLGGHGNGDPADFIGIGIAAGEATGWGKIKPVKPDPLFSFKNKNYIPVAPGEPVTAAAWGDVDGDGKPDVVISTRDDQGAAVKIYLNQGGKFSAQAEVTVPVPDAAQWLRLVHVSEGKVADIFVSREGATPVLLRPQGGKLDYRVVPLSGPTRATQLLVDDFNGDGRRDLLIGGWFVNGYWVCLQQADGSFKVTDGKGLKPGIYFTLALADVNGDGRADLLSGEGDVLLRQADGTLPETASLHLTPPAPSWNFLSAADFNGDGREDAVLMAPDGQGKINFWAYYNTGDAQRPFPPEPSQKLAVAVRTDARSGTTVGDWNGDGIPDLLLYSEGEATILLGSKQGLTAERVVKVPLDYNPRYDNPLGMYDYNGDGKPDLAGWGTSAVRAQGVYIWLGQ